MKKQIVILIALMVLLLTASVAFGQKTTHLRFGRGATSVTASGYLNGYRAWQVFIIRVRPGQKLSTTQVKSNNSRRYITVEIKSPQGEDVGDSDASCNNRKMIDSTDAGEYRITVTECKKADPWRGNFQLRINVK